MPEISKVQADALSHVLSQNLSRNEEGRRILADLAADRPGALEELGRYLRVEMQHNQKLAEQVDGVLGRGDGPITNVVTDSHVDQIINIARLNDLNLTQYRQFFLFRDLKQLVAFLVITIGVAASVAGGIYYVRWKNVQPSVMDGDFNVAIARFAKMTDDGPAASRDTLRFMNALCTYLDSEYRATDFGLDVQISHTNMPVITEDLEAKKLAEKTNADLVIYGTVAFGEGEGRFLPSFYVADQPSTDEVTGYNELGTPIRFDADFDSEEELYHTLQARAAILVNFTRGLIYLADENLDGALYSFQEAARESETIDPFGGQEVLYLMLAYSQRLLQQHETAITTLEKALALNPEYARAYIGLGNNLYALFKESGRSDRALLDEALGAYERAMVAGDRPPSAYIAEKAAIGAANVIFEEAAMAGGDLTLLEEAIVQLQSVTSRYETLEEPNLARIAGYAYYNLGYYLDLRGDTDDAIAAYQRAADLPTDALIQRKALAELEALGVAPSE